MKEVQDLNLTFSGCGFLGIYHLGVVSCLKENAPALLKRVKCYGGASAGSFAAAALLLDLNTSDSAEFVIRLAKRANSLTLGPLHPSFNVVRTLRRSFERILPDNAHELASGRLHLSLTRVSDLKNVIVSEFFSKEDLVEVSFLFPDSLIFQMITTNNSSFAKCRDVRVNVDHEKKAAPGGCCTLHVALSTSILAIIAIANKENQRFYLASFLKGKMFSPSAVA